MSAEISRIFGAGLTDRSVVKTAVLSTNVFVAVKPEPVVEVMMKSSLSFIRCEIIESSLVRRDDRFLNVGHKPHSLCHLHSNDDWPHRLGSAHS